MLSELPVPYTYIIWFQFNRGYGKPVALVVVGCHWSSTTLDEGEEGIDGDGAEGLMIEACI